MSAFKVLRDVSNKFEADLRGVSNDLFTAKIDEPFEDIIFKKLNALSFYNSKLRLMKANLLSDTTQADEQTNISNYTEAVKWKIVEQQVLKAVNEGHQVKALITAADSNLSPDMLERKEKIIEQLKKFKDKEIQLRHLDSLLQERQRHLEEVTREWDDQLGLLRQKSDNRSEMSDDDHTNPLSSKLHKMEGKLSTMRSLLAMLASARGGGYDWLTDPRRRLRALQLARQSEHGAQW